METVIILFETDLHASKSYRVLCGVFSGMDEAVKAAKENDLYNTARGVQPEFVEATINQFEEL